MADLRRAALLAASVALLPGAAPGNRPVDLFSDGLPLWFRWIGVPYPGLEGVPEGAPIGDGMTGVPLGIDGYPDVFTLTREGSEPVLRVSGKLYGALTSKARYGDYHLRFQYRWGEATYPPRRPDQPRDSGVLIHLTDGLEDAHWSVFLMGLESHPFQGIHYLIKPFIDDESISKAVVSADFYFVIANGSSSPVHGPGTMVPKQARKQPPRAAGAY